MCMEQNQGLIVLYLLTLTSRAEPNVGFQASIIKSQLRMHAAQLIENNFGYVVLVVFVFVFVIAAIAVIGIADIETDHQNLLQG